MDVPARAERLDEDFRRRFDRAPDGVWAAPGRVNLLGEHTDYNDGLVLPFAIDRQALAAVALRADGVVRCWSRQYEDSAEGRAGTDWRRYPEAVVQAARDIGLIDASVGLDLALDSDVPVGAGLSSSAALEVAVALALSELAAGPAADGPAPDVPTLARLCQRAENVHVGAPTGLLDPMASLTGRSGSAYLLDCRDLTGRFVPLPLPGLAILVVDTRVSHAVADGGYARRRAECEQAARLLGLTSLRDARLDQLSRLPEPERRRARHVLTENDRVATAVERLTDERTGEIGPLLDASHASLRNDFEVSCPELDVAVEQARSAGALGARMTGAGFGGSIVALVPEGRLSAVEAAARDGFAARGWREPAAFRVTPAPGAVRVLPRHERLPLRRWQ